MKYIKFLVLGVIFGIILSKAEIVSWYRIYEMFSFDSFHMYGIIGSAILFGALGVAIIKKFSINDIYGDKIILPDKDRSITRYFLGGTIFGLGWALAGACPGPMFILLGHGYLTMLIVIISAIVGTLFYGIFRNKLPH